MAHVINEVCSDIPVGEMKDGQVAVVTNWNDSRMIGTVVQRFCNTLICIGKGSGYAYSELLTDSPTSDSVRACRVRVLPAGTQIEL